MEEYSMTDQILSNLQKEKIIEGIAQGIRLDGRKLEEYREIQVETGISKNAESAVRVRIGKTEVYAGVKMAVTEPYPDSPDKGTFMTTVELHPMSSNYFDLGKPGIQAVELGRVIDRGIRESGFIDFEKLCIQEGKKVWQVFLDIITINDDGNLLDTAGLAAIIALGQAKMPKYNEEENKIEKEFTGESIPLNTEALSFNITLHNVEGKILVDPTVEEEFISDYRLSIALGEVTGKARITAMQKGKEGAISEEDMEAILTIAEETFKKHFPHIKKLVFGS